MINIHRSPFPSLRKAGIVVTTRNREQDLRKLFFLLRKSPGLRSDLPVWLHDDASTDVSSDYWQFLQDNFEYVTRSPFCHGLIVSRNICNASAPFEYIFSLDDDSCFVDHDGPLKAIEYLDRNPTVAALALPLVESLQPDSAPKGIPTPHQIYIGCAHVIRKSVFLELGGYRSDFVHQGEEPELCMRIWKSGYEVHSFPQCRVHHWVSPRSRQSTRVGYYGARNRLLNHFYHAPLANLALDVPRIFASYAKLSLKSKVPISHLKGFFSGIYNGMLSLPRRSPMNTTLYRYVTSLPLYPRS